MTNLTPEEALEGIKNIPLPAASEGDIAWYPGGPIDGDRGYRFKYQDGEWISHPE